MNSPNHLVAIYRLASSGQYEFVAAFSKEHFPKDLPFTNYPNQDLPCDLVFSIKRGITAELDCFRVVEVDGVSFLLDALCQPHSVIGT